MEISESGAEPVELELIDNEPRVIREQKNPLCEMCNANQWKYTCPRCSIHTCSVSCIKQHKSESGCTGERDKTKFVQRSEYNYSHMMNDYVYLEDIARTSDTLTRERLRMDSENQNSKSKEQRLKALARKIKSTGVLYQMLPSGMSRHNANRTNYSQNQQTIYWTIECIFCRNEQRQRIMEHSIPYTKTLRAFFENLLFLEKPQGKGDYPLIRQQLKDFVNAGLEQFVVALKKEKSTQRTFINLLPHLDKSWKDVLHGETIIEFPTVYIWLAGEMQDNILLEEKLDLQTGTDQSKGNEQPPEETIVHQEEDNNTQQDATTSTSS